MTETQEPVWKALADPTRREILDLLRLRERTTGELCAHFGLSRFGVMKHLGILRDGGLVVTRARGRERWNHLNAVPIREVYERWVSRYAGDWAARLSALKRFTETGKERDKPMQNVASKSFEIVQEHQVNAPLAKVWRSLTADIDCWWPHRTMGNDSTMHLEHRAGGSFIERAANGDETLWGTVLLWRKEKMIAFRGPVGMTRYTMVNMYSFELVEKDGGTLVKLLHRAFGELGDDWAEDFRGGWGEQWRFLDAWLTEGKTFRELQ